MSPETAAKGARTRLLWFGLLTLLGLVLPLIFNSMLIHHFLILIGINIILVMSLDIVIGHLGLSALGHGGFQGIGAYTCALMVMNWEVPFLGGLIAAMAMAALFGFLIGYPSLRLRGHYFVIVTFISGIVFNLFFTNLVGITKGPMGLPGIPAPAIGVGSFKLVFADKLSYYYLVLFFVILTTLFKSRFYHSRMGRALAAIKEEEDLSRAIGIRTHMYKVSAFSISAAGAGLAGGLYAHYLRFIGPDSFTFLHSFDLFVMNLVGGVGTILGPIIGPAILTLIDEISQFFRPEFARIMFGVSLILIILYMPQGIIGQIKALWGGRR